MATAVTLQSGQPTANNRIFSILQGCTKMTKELQEALDSAAEAFEGESYKIAAKYYNDALDSWTGTEEKHQRHSIILTKYMLCICWLESSDTKVLLEALKTLEELEKSYCYAYPMLYYAIGKANIKLYRFSKAEEVVKKGFALLNTDIVVNPFYIPRTTIVIPESSREGLVSALLNLKTQCSAWHQPDAVCRLPECLTYSDNEGIDRRIFYRSPTFYGMVQVSCNNPNACIMNYHIVCWKAKKEQLCSLGKMSDKDVLNLECFTPNCENDGVRCTIKKIEIFDENAESKAVIPARPEEVVWHAKTNPPPKGAIRKQQQQQAPKVKVPSAGSRAATCERPGRSQTGPNNIPAHSNTLTHRKKIDENEEDEIDDEQLLKASIERLQELRANNFGIKDDAMWRPDLQMYGNECMLATAELIPDPDFSDSGTEEADLKAFFFSYFFEFISANGPVKLDVLAEKWIEAKAMDANSDTVLKHFPDITEFLLQSVKFAVIGDNICVAGKLPEAYELAKNRTFCEILRFFLENEVDRLSNSSAVDDDAAYNAIINSETNDNSLPYSSVFGDDKVQESSGFSNPPQDIHKIDDKKDINDLNMTPVATSSPPPTPKTSKTETLFEFTGKSRENGIITTPEVFVFSNTTEEKKPTPQSQIPAEKNVATATRKRKNESLPLSLSCSAAEVADKKSKPIVKKATESWSESSKKTVRKMHKPQKEEQFIFPPLKSSFSFEKLTEPIEPKINFTKGCNSTNDLRASVLSFVDNHKARMNNTGETDDGILEQRSFLSTPRRIEANSSNSEYQKISDTHTGITKVLQDYNAELSGKSRRLESELEHEKGRHARTRVKLLQKNLQYQHSYNQLKIFMRLEECNRIIDVCACIQAMLKNTLGHNMPNFETKWMKLKEELEQISKNHKKKYDEMNEQFFATNDLEKIEEVNLELEPLPDSPQIKLTDVIQNAFDIFRNEYHRMRSPPSAIRSPQTQQIGTSQLWQPNPELFAGAQLIHQGNPALNQQQQQNYMRNLSSIYERNSANSTLSPPIRLPQNVQLPFSYYPYTELSYPPVNPSVPQMQPIPSTPVQQHLFNPPQRKTPSAQRNSSSANQIPQSQNSTSENFPAAEHSKPNPYFPSSSPLSIFQSLSNFSQQNGQLSEKSDNRSMTFEQLAAKFNKGSSNFTELPTVSSTNEQSVAPVPKNSTSNGNKENLEQSPTANSQPANSVPEIPKILKEVENVATIAQKDLSGQEKTMAQKDLSGQENMENGGGSRDWVELLKQLDLNKKEQTSVVSENNGAKKKQPKLNSKSLKTPPPSTDEHQVNTQEEIVIRATENTPNHNRITPGKSETLPKVNEKKKDMTPAVNASKVKPKEAKSGQKSEHSVDKLMKRLRKKYAGVLELDLLKAIEAVRKLHNNSLTGVPMSAIIREADRYILDRQQKQLCGYVKRMPNAYSAASNVPDRPSWTPTVEEERKRQTSVPSTSSGSSVKKESHHPSSSTKKWEPVVNPNIAWKKETPETDCTICHESMLRTASYTLQCQHTFHKMCIKTWYQRNQSCPVCRLHSTIDDEFPPLPLG